VAHRTFEIGLRAWVEHSGLAARLCRKLYTFGDRGRHTEPGDTDAHMVSIGYLALTRAATMRAGAWRDLRTLVSLFPGRTAAGAARDHRTRYFSRTRQMGRARRDAGTARALGRKDRCSFISARRRAMGRGARARPLRAALNEAGLVKKPGGTDARRRWRAKLPCLGIAMRFDHRRILATRIARLRAS